MVSALFSPHRLPKEGDRHCKEHLMPDRHSHSDNSHNNCMNKGGAFDFFNLMPKRQVRLTAQVENSSFSYIHIGAGLTKNLDECLHIATDREAAFFSNWIKDVAHWSQGTMLSDCALTRCGISAKEITTTLLLPALL